MKKDCTICKRIKLENNNKGIGRCDFLSEIPRELKNELAQYCDFFKLKDN